MRTGLLLAAAVVLAAPAATAAAADPPIVYQTQPMGRVLDEARVAVAILGGEKAVLAFNEGIKNTLGEKGFEGLDLSRPVVGYVLVPADPRDTVAVVAFPVTGEKEWLDFCERWNKSKPKPLAGGLYEVPPVDPGLKAVMRVADGYAYVATAVKDPGPALDPKAIVPAAKLVDPAEQALLAGRVYFDRFPKELRPKLAELLAEGKKAIAGIPFPADIADLGKAELEQLAKLTGRYLDLSQGAKEAALRVRLDPGTGDLWVEATLTAVPGSPLDRIIANKKPTANRFAGFLTPDTATGFQTRLPFFNDELRTAAVTALEELRKQAANNLPVQPKALIDEILKGVIRTVKTGEFDVAGAVRGPAKDGTFTAVGAVAFEDPSAVEKELRKALGGEAFLGDALKWDAEKVEGVSIHTLDLAKAGIPNDLKRMFGENAMLAFAFAPKAVYGAVGPGDEAVKAVKGALALKPAEARVLDVVINPARVVKLAATVEGERAAAEVAKAFGADDKLISAASLSITGGKELTVKFGLNLKMFPRAIGFGGSAAAPPPAGVQVPAK